jgi:hypothetical protein|tara:strand:- start:98 stop:493 length:396 start_codon:yes stop_codon:yes gene_type:complete
MNRQETNIKIIRGTKKWKRFMNCVHDFKNDMKQEAIIRFEGKTKNSIIVEIPSKSLNIDGQIIETKSIKFLVINLVVKSSHILGATQVEPILFFKSFTLKDRHFMWNRFKRELPKFNVAKRKFKKAIKEIA